MKYFVISSDGDINVSSMQKDELLEKLDNDYWGEKIILNEKSDISRECGIMIIKGEVVSPTKVETVVKHDIP